MDWILRAIAATLHDAQSGLIAAAPTTWPMAFDNLAAISGGTPAGAYVADQDDTSKSFIPGTSTMVCTSGYWARRRAVVTASIFNLPACDRPPAYSSVICAFSISSAHFFCSAWI